jgi:hypothetical protein
VDGGQIIALVSIGATVLLTILGGVFKVLLGRIAKFATDLELAKKTIEEKKETIALLREQISEYRITAVIQNRFFESLPPRKSTSGD